MVYTDENSRSPLKTLLLAIIILAVLSLCVWGGLRLYNRSLAPRTSQRAATAELMTGLLIRIPAVTPAVKEDTRDFAVQGCLAE
jgi:hypothetical protein